MENSKFLEYKRNYNVAKLSLFEEVLLKTGFDTAYMCRSLNTEETINKVKGFVQQLCEELENKPDIPRENFQLDFVTKQRWKAIGKYSNEKSLSFFAKTLFPTPRVVRRRRLNRPSSSEPSTTLNPSPKTSPTSTIASNVEPSQTSTVASSSTSNTLPPRPSNEELRLELLRIARNAYTNKKLIQGDTAVAVVVTEERESNKGKVTCPFVNCSDELSPYFNFYKGKYRWYPST